MVWTIELTQTAEKQLSKLDRQVQKEITRFLEVHIASTENPKQRGKPLQGRLKGLWRYRMGDYRIICRIEDNKLVVLVIAIGHRKEIYE